MSRLQRVKEALAATTRKLCADVEKSHKEGKIPADYSLGFTNAAIFFDHALNMREGKPKQYDRVMAVGSLPKPVVLKTSERDEQAYEFLRDSIQVRARAVLASTQSPNVDTLEVTGETVKLLLDLRESIKALDQFLEDQHAVSESVLPTAGEGSSAEIPGAKKSPEFLPGTEHFNGA